MALGNTSEGPYILTSLHVTSLHLTTLRLYKFRGSSLQMFFKTGFFKNFAMFTAKYLYWSLFLLKMQAYRSANLLKREYNTGVFPQI